MYYERRHLVGMDITLDGRRFVNCVIKNCKLIYTGGDLPSFKGCNLSGNSWVFTGEAGNTLIFLSALHGPWDSKDVVERVFMEVKKAPPEGRPSKRPYN